MYELTSLNSKLKSLLIEASWKDNVFNITSQNQTGVLYSYTESLYIICFNLCEYLSQS